MALDSDFFDTEKFIIEVEKRPALYTKNLPEYSDRNVKEKLWIEVCEASVPKWGQLQKDEKIKKGKEIQRRWKNMRDSFRKELNLQTKMKSGDGKKTRRQYLFFNQLLFLLPSVQERDTSANYSQPRAPEDEDDDEEEEEEVAEGEEEGDGEENITQTRDPGAASSAVRQQRQKKRKQPTYEESLLNILKGSATEEIDEDKSFLQSLLPSFKKLSDQQKFKTKMDFLQVLQKAMFPADDQGPVPTHSSYPPRNIQQSSGSSFHSAGTNTNVLGYQINPQQSTIGMRSSIQFPPYLHPQSNLSPVGSYYSTFSSDPESSQRSTPISRASPGNATALSDSDLIDLVH